MIWLGSIVLGLALIAAWYSTKPTRPKTTTHLNTAYDYVIVGGGAAGTVLARRLSESPDVSVLLLEAGEDEMNNPVYDIPWNAPSAQMTKADWMYYTEPQQHACLSMKEQRQYIPRGKGLGGSTLVNGLCYVRGSREDYDKWASDGCDGWGYDEVLPYFLKSEDVGIPDLENSPYHSNGGPLVVSDSVQAEITKVFLSAGSEFGYDVTDCNGNNGNQTGFCRMQTIVGDAVRWHTARGFLWPVMDRPNLHVVVGAHVSKIRIDNNKATGVDFILDGRKKTVNSKKEVVLAAGSVGSPQLLMLSGIGPRDHLQDLGIPVVADLPVGSQIQDHGMFMVKADIKEPFSYTADKINSWWTWLQYYLLGSGPLISNAAVEGTAWLRTMGESNKYPDVELIFFASLAEHGDAYDHFNHKDEVNEELYTEIHKSTASVEGFTVALEGTHPRSTGTIRLKSRDPFDYPLIQPNYFKDPSDLKPFVNGVKEFRRLLETPSMKKVGAKFRNKPFSGCSSQSFDSDAYWECMVRHLTVSGYHICCGARMGKSTDSTAVLDPNLRVKGVSGLRVVDSSIFPSVTSGNTMAPTLMIAEKGADLIKSDNPFYKQR